MSIRRVLLLGATGPTGRHVLEQATAMGLELTVLVRAPERLPATTGRVGVVTGDILADPPANWNAYAGQDAVISTLGVGQTFKSGGLITRAVPLIVGAMRQHGIRRLVFTSALGVGATWRDVPLLPKLFMKTLLRDIYADKAAGEEGIRTSGLDWTIVYPTILTNGPRTDRVSMGERLSLSGFPRVSRADVAAVLLRQLDDDRFIGKGVVVSS